MFEVIFLNWFCNYALHMYDQKLCGPLLYGHTPNYAENIFLQSPHLLLGLVSLIYAPFSLESKRSIREG